MKMTIVHRMKRIFCTSKSKVKGHLGSIFREQG